MSKTNCDVCGRRAKFHETSLHDGVVSERHLCGIHGNREWFASIRELLARHTDVAPAEWLPPGLERQQLKQWIAKARTLAEARKGFRPR